MLTKIADLPQPCLNPEHNPPNMIVLAPGVYRHTCPGCGAEQTFTVPRFICSTVAVPVKAPTMIPGGFPASTTGDPLPERGKLWMNHTIAPPENICHVH